MPFDILGDLVMEVRYLCNNCQTLFVNPLIEDGMFVCPNCETPEFEKIKINPNIVTEKIS